MRSLFLLIGCLWGFVFTAAAAFTPKTPPSAGPRTTTHQPQASSGLFERYTPITFTATTRTVSRPVQPFKLSSKEHVSLAQSFSFPLYQTTNVAQDAGGSFSSSRTATTTTTNAQIMQRSLLPAWKSQLTKMGMIAYIAGMCLALPLTLLPQQALYQLGWIDRQRKEAWAVRTAGFCARWMLRLIPFTRLNVIPSGETFIKNKKLPAPSIWVCNHMSMLDVFMLLAADKRLRGKYKRPIKIVYWQQLEKNPITRLMFTQAGFISVDMAANGSGTANEYDKTGFKKLLKDCKQAFDEGYDIGILPEGQLNPTPEKGLLPVFSGAYTLAKMSRRPIQFMALHGTNKLWHADESTGMNATDRTVTVRCYPFGRPYESAEEWKATFEAIVGHFGATGHDLPIPELKGWLTGETWRHMQGGPPKFHKRADRREKGKMKTEGEQKETSESKNQSSQ